MTPSITETQIITALRAFILAIVDCEVIRSPNNRVAMPVGEFISLTPMGIAALSTNTTTYSATDKAILRSSQITIQVDCYGASAGDRAAAITMLLRDPYGCESMAGAGVQPLYAGDARQMPMVDGESQYIERWSFDAVLQANPALTVAQQSAASLGVDVQNVDRVYPP